MTQDALALLPWIRRGAVALSLIVHAALVAWLITATTISPEQKHQGIAIEVVRLQRPPAPPQPAPPPPSPPVAPAKPVVRIPVPQMPQEIISSTPKPPPPTYSSHDDEWIIPATSTTNSPGPRRVPNGYADDVKSRIVAKIEYPPDAIYKLPKNFKGDPRTLRRQCTIPYEIVVDRSGRMISHHIESCDDPVLDAAAEAALLKAGPFTPPPDLGAEQYVIYGSANFRIDGSSISGGVR